MIKFQNVHKYLCGRHILKGLDFRVRKGEILVLLGPTGTGKSVALRHIVGLHVADEGEVLVDGRNVGELSHKALEALRARFGVLFQAGALLDWMNVKDNVALPLKEKTKMTKSEIDEKVSDVLEMVGLKDDGFKMPANISGGMRKRAGLARAIITDPEIVLYDEPTSGLDPVFRRELLDVLLEILQDEQASILFSTHITADLDRIADYVTLLQAGPLLVAATTVMMPAAR